MADSPRILTHVLMVSLCAALPVDRLGAATYRVAETLFVDTVPSWFPVGFCLLTHDTQQYVAYYNQEHQMMVARRRLGENGWQKVSLPSRVGWDSHNGVTMAVDAKGHLHLSGNMLFHVVWVWRDTPDCATNHHLSYVRSRDLKKWETAQGKPVALPLTLGQAELCVDPIPSGGGIINGCEKTAFDAKHRPILSYHKLDQDGHMQIYVARFQDGRWEIHPVTQWEKNITFGGGGAMPFIGIRIGPLEPLELGLFSIRYRHRDYGSGRIILEESTLRPVDRELAVPREYPAELTRATIAFAGIGTRIAADLGESGEPHQKFVLRWETLEPHYDRPRKPPLPPPSRLQLVKLVKEQ